MINNLCKMAIENGGKLVPLIVPYEISKGTGQMNPSILFDNDKIIVNVRNVGYVLIHSENEQRFPSRWGPLLYTHPENDLTLRTTNVYMELDENYLPIRINAVDTSILDVPPKWEFIGLEDIRLVRWDDKLYMCGVRRDTTPNGVGRMELSEIFVDEDSVAEISRMRIEVPNKESYCEKNWMPILDMPFHYIKWSNPIEIVKVNFETKTAETVFTGTTVIPNIRDFRGGSQVLPYGENRIALVHEVELFNNEVGQKDAYYYHRLLVWDKNWNLVKASDSFRFLDERVGFSCGMLIKDNKVIIPFGDQDNVAYMLEMSLEFMGGLLHG
jgi:hypothetical protein